MKLKADKLEEINAHYEQNCKNGKSDRNVYFKNAFKLRVENSIHGATIIAGNWTICEVDKLSELLNELEIIRDVIEDETGIVC